NKQNGKSNKTKTEARALQRNSRTTIKKKLTKSQIDWEKIIHTKKFMQKYVHYYYYFYLKNFSLNPDQFFFFFSHFLLCPSSSKRKKDNNKKLKQE
ncbi:hypothetical protein RFI_38006, partial [Reticulomyxa filosa]